MENAMRANWRGWFAYCLLLAFVPCLTVCSDNTQLPKPPLSLSFDVKKAGSKVETELIIIERQTYAFNLEYPFRENDQVDRARVWNLAGGSRQDESGRWIELGAPLKIELKISRKNEGLEQSVYEGSISNPHLSSWGGNSLNAKLVHVLMEPGTYVVSAENLSDAPEFSGTKVRLSIVRAYLGK
jgi:hypothetical protein